MIETTIAVFLGLVAYHVTAKVARLYVWPRLERWGLFR